MGETVGNKNILHRENKNEPPDWLQPIGGFIFEGTQPCETT
jgi:hypothetical protein